MALFKKEVKSKYIPISDLVEGEIYKCSFPSMRVFMYEKLESVIGYKYLIANSQWFLKDSCISDKVYFSTIQKATLVDKMHLDACIEANKYISLIDALQVSKVELKFEKGAFVEYLGTDASNELWNQYFGCYDIVKGDVGVISSVYDKNNIYVKDAFGSQGECKLTDKDLRLITEEEYKSKLRYPLPQEAETKEVEKWSKGTYVVFLEDDLQGNFKKKGCVEEVVACYKYSLQIDIVYRDGYSNAIEGEVSVADKIKWFATKQEAEIFSKELLGNKPNLKANTGKFKAGDKVKVVRKAKDYEGDWVDTWISTPIGSIKTIERTVGNRGYVMREGFNYPEFVLELVEENKNSKTDIHIHKGNTDDEVYEGEIYVDDQDLVDCNSDDVCGGCRGTGYGEHSNNSSHYQCEGSWCQEGIESWKEDNFYPGHSPSEPEEILLTSLDSEILSRVEKTKLPKISVLSFDDED